MNIKSALLFLITFITSLQAAQAPLESWQANNRLEQKIHIVLSENKEAKKHKKSLESFLKQYGSQITSFNNNNMYQLEMSDPLLNLLTRYCKNLKKIQLVFCEKVTIIALKKFFEKQTQLEEIDLMDIPHLTQEFINIILKNHKKLTYLAFIGCNIITDENLNDISTNLPHLKTLTLANSGGWSKHAMQTLRKASPNLSICTNFFLPCSAL